MKKFNVNFDSTFSKIALTCAVYTAVVLICSLILSEITDSYIGMEFYRALKTVFLLGITLPFAFIGSVFLFHVSGFITINGKEFNDKL